MIWPGCIPYATPHKLGLVPLVRAVISGVPTKAFLAHVAHSRHRYVVFPYGGYFADDVGAELRRSATLILASESNVQGLQTVFYKGGVDKRLVQFRIQYDESPTI